MMQDQTQTETILLVSNEVDDQPDEKALQNVTAQLQQINLLRGVKKLLKNYDNRFISVTEVSTKRKFSYWVNLIYLDPNPIRKRNIKWMPGLIGLVLMLNAIGALYIYVNNPDTRSIPYFFSSSIILLTVALVMLLYMAYKSLDTVIFVSHHGRIPMIELMYNNPDKKQFKHFIGNIRVAIEALQKKSFYNEVQLLAAELSEHRRLMEKGILTKDDYTLAKTNIFSQHTPVTTH